MGAVRGAPRMDSGRKLIAQRVPPRSLRARRVAVASVRSPGGPCFAHAPSVGILTLDISKRYIGCIYRRIIGETDVLELAILGLLKEQDLHGYELKKRLAETLGLGSGVSFGSLYPALGRL